MNKCPVYVDLREILRDLHDVCFCPECGAVMPCKSHFCEKCKERVAIPIDGDCFIRYFADKYKNKLLKQGR